ncbi:MAG: hypothetical protein EYC70_01755 [Planctomycetota bacterium]|nr:MAG: hypothetical protein EYC70_01755 [Planctomycetota bacterium]
MGDRFVHQDTAAVPGRPEHADRFGYALRSGDFNNDGKDELAIGIPVDTVIGVRGGAAL